MTSKRESYEVYYDYVSEILEDNDISELVTLSSKIKLTKTKLKQTIDQLDCLVPPDADKVLERFVESAEIKQARQVIPNDEIVGSEPAISLDTIRLVATLRNAIIEVKTAHPELWPGSQSTTEET